MPFIGPKPADTVLDSTLIGDGTITSAKIADGTIVNADLNNSAAIANSKLATDPTNASNLASGTVPSARISEASVTQHVTAFDDNKIQANIALLGFKTAVNGSLAVYNLVDQVVDEYTDATGIDASASTNETLTSGYYKGAAVSTPSITHDADQTGVDGDYTWYKWTDTGSTGSFSTNTAQTVDWLVVAGGGAGAADNLGGGVGGSRGVGGGGAGGLRTSYGSTSGGGASAEADLSLGAGTTYTITVGAGGAGQDGSGSPHYYGLPGGTSSITGSDITDITTVGGGGGEQDGTRTSGTGGSSGGGFGSGSVGSATANQGYQGGTGASSSNQGSGGGGGGAGGAGGNGSSSWSNGGGAGGAGLSVSITGSAVVYAAGGGGGRNSSGSDNGGSSGVGGNGGDRSAGTAGDANTGSGGGGAGGMTNDNAKAGGNGGSGVVILRRLTSTSTIGDLILQSNDTTAQAVPTKADMVTLIENASGTATLNTDIKGWISRDSGANFTQGTLVDEGTWGTNKKVLAFHDLDISGQPSGTSMCYKITTHNQSAGSKETRIHATSIGWK